MKSHSNLRVNMQLFFNFLIAHEHLKIHLLELAVMQKLYRVDLLEQKRTYKALVVNSPDVAILFFSDEAHSSVIIRA